MKEALVRLRLSEIEYDVKFDTWNRGNNAEKPNEKVIYKGGDQLDWLLRKVEDALGELKGALRWCVVDHAHMTDDEIMDAPEYWELRFCWKSDWHGSRSSLKSFAHQFIVNFALAAWYEAVGLSFETYLAKATKAKEDIVSAARLTSLPARPFRL